MKLSLLLLLLPLGSTAGFTVPNPAKATSLELYLEKPKPKSYTPKGFTDGNWAAFKGAEKREQQAKKKKHFKSRPLVDFQKDLEAGKVR